MKRIEARLKKLEGQTVGESIACLISPSKQRIKRMMDKHSAGGLTLFIANIRRDKGNGHTN